ncbi:MAG: hypothetical protein K2O47_08385, partial [Muribaculaceae bacterium]|nr:hypothetical protein [Muribaculaceae bacterium]
ILPLTLSVDLKKVVDLENDDSTLINYGEVRHADNVVVKISDIKVGNTGDTASVEFFFAPIYSNGKYDESYFNDNEYLRLAEFVYENGGWKVDDIGWDVHIMYGINFAEESYKQYVRKYK